MSDAAIQGYIQTLIRATTAFSRTDVTLGDFGVLERGSTPYAVVLPGRIVAAARSGDWAQVSVIWEHTVEVFELFGGDDYAAFSAARQAVIDAIGQNPTLGGQSEISNAIVGDGTAPLYLYRDAEDDHPTFVFSRVTVRSTEEVSYAGSGEFA